MISSILVGSCSPIQINTNGIISLDDRFTDSSSEPLLLSDNDKIIAPFWADVDTRGIGDIFYRQTKDSIFLNRATGLIRAAFPAAKNVTDLFIATWDNVGYFSQNTDKVSILKFLCT